MPKNIVIGTAQFDQDYGISRRKKNNLKDLIKYLSHLKKKNYTLLDTAPSYGFAEYLIGEHNKTYKKKKFKIYSKIDRLPKIKDKKKLFEVLKYNLINSKKILGGPIQILFIHNFSDFKKNNNFLIKSLKKINKNNIFKEIGVSIYHPYEALYALRFKDIKHIQIPLNILDHRWSAKRFLEAIKKHKRVQFHARSVFLQGLLLNNNSWPAWYKDKKATIKLIEKLRKKFNFENKIDLCLSYVQSFSWIKSIILGFESANQLNYFDKYYRKKKGKNKFNEFRKNMIVQEIKKTIKNKRILLPYLW